MPPQLDNLFAKPNGPKPPDGAMPPQLGNLFAKPNGHKPLDGAMPPQPCPAPPYSILYL